MVMNEREVSIRQIMRTLEVNHLIWLPESHESRLRQMTIAGLKALLEQIENAPDRQQAMAIVDATAPRMRDPFQPPKPDQQSAFSESP